jgi:molybdate transport system permease protein
LPDAASSFLGLPAPLWQSLSLTLRLAAITTVVLGLIGLPLAHWLRLARLRLLYRASTVTALIFRKPECS